MSDTDLELLARYTRHHAEDAFAEIVRRHLDLVHSAALRQVRSPQLAEEVAQSTFIKLAGHAHRLAPDTILTAWLYQVARRESTDVIRREARRQLREQIATEMNAINATTTDWTHIEPLLEEAMHALDDTDRTAVLLRYFENKSLRQVGETLGTSDDTAQKRVSRAVERLREFFARRGVAISSSGLVVVISAHAVQAAPVGLALTISTAAALAVATTTTLTHATAVTMSWINAKTSAAIIGAAVIAGTGTYFVQQQKLSRADAEHRASLHLREQEAAARDAALAAMRAQEQELEGLRKQVSELSRLRSETAQLRRENEVNEQRPTRKAATPPAAVAGTGPLAVPIEPGKYISKDQLSFGGYTTPEASAQSQVWAMASKNYAVATNSFSPEMLQFILAESEGEYSQSFSEGLGALTGMQVIARKVLSDDRVEIKLQLDVGQGQPNSTVLINQLVRVGNEWKIGGESREYTPEWDQGGAIQTFTR